MKNDKNFYVLLLIAFLLLCLTISRAIELARDFNTGSTEPQPERLDTRFLL